MSICKAKRGLEIRNKQRGAVLIVGLVMVLLMTIIGLSAIRGSGLQELMAGNMKDRNIAFQSAESALRHCEQNILGPTILVAPVANCVAGGGICDDLDATPANSVLNSDTYWAARAIAPDFTLPNVASQPACLVEILPINAKAAAAAVGGAIGLSGIKKSGFPSPYRVSAQGVGTLATTPAMTQSTYNRLF